MEATGMCRNYHLEPVTVAFVERLPAQRSNIRLFAAGQQRVQLAGVFDGGRELLAALRRGMRPQVLVIDQWAVELSLFAMLREIRMLEAGYLPYIILTVPVPLDGKTCDLLLTSGINSVMLKPYTLPQLFEEIFLRVAEPGEATVYRIRAAYAEQMHQLGASSRLHGWRYLERMVCEDLLTGRNKNLKELYHVVARAEQLSDHAVGSGLKRLAEQLCAADTPAYRRLCEEIGAPAGVPLSNGALLRGVADLIRRAVTG